MCVWNIGLCVCVCVEHRTKCVCVWNIGLSVCVCGTIGLSVCVWNID